ncbi:hypothetical protein CMEL01_11022 [Colletotrichum melonis]|uniref:Heterokaryon incompatibility domain-containing protein n=1 Tax=Colletotrichum melonis TaxID=1209925 RepID=A0AAI9XZW1_9PEZI|nr:hypothetical protein CMEL01_11022 [Colletotrichum melonis]
MTYPGNSLRRELENRWELDIPEYEYSPIDRDAQEQRFLILHPCPGDKSDPQNHVRCSIEVRPLAKAGSFIAIRDSRGYRLLRDVIEIDGKGLVVPVALEVFLRYFRGHRLPVTLWIRYICLEEFSSAEDQKEYWTRDFLDSMYARATQVVSMTEVVTELLERGIVEKRIQSKYRKWDKTWHYIQDKSEPPFRFTLPKIYPIKLGKSPSNDATVTNLDYVPLDMLVGEIRILVVTPSEDREAPVIAHLAHCPMVCEVSYHALSYTWGNAGDTVEIVVNGHRMQVRRNLEQALRTIRSKEVSMPIWIDALCIDQLNVAERTRQVARMFDIYDRASQVICYVGEHSDETDMALDFVKPMDQLKIEMNKKGEYNIGKEGNKIGPDLYPARCAALYKFMCRPYFRRVWVVQEVAISSDPAVIVDNRKAVAFGSLDAAAYNLQAMIAFNPVLRTQMMSADPQLHQFGLSYDELIFIRKLFYFRHLMAGGELYSPFFSPTVRKDSPGFLEAAILTRDFQATDGRDKIFALWNLAQDKEGLNFKLDYNKSRQQVFVDFATAWSRQHGSLDIIAASEPWHNVDKFYSLVPSWCPDWTVPAATSCLVRRERIPMRPMRLMDDLDGELYSADGGIGQLRDFEELFSFNKGILDCRGVILDEIDEIIEDPGRMPSRHVFHPPDPDAFYKFQEWTAAIPKIYQDREANPYDDPLQAAIAMFHGDVTSAWNCRGQDPEKLEALSARLNKTKEQSAWLHYDCITAKSRHIPTHEWPFSYEGRWWFDIVQSVLRGRTLCITKKGYMALLPSYISEKTFDKPWLLAVIATCSVPVLLQEVDSVDGKTVYRFGGTCFVQGWMEGEMLMRPEDSVSPAGFWFTDETRRNALHIR